MLQHGGALKALCQVKEVCHKDHVLYDSIYMKFPEEANPQRQKAN